MLLTKEFIEVWNSLVRMGFSPTMIDYGTIDVIVRSTSDDLDFIAAVGDYSPIYYSFDAEHNRRYYQIGRYDIRVTQMY